MTVLLGPCKCQGCGKLVTLNERMVWVDADGLSHSCIRAPKISRRYWAVGKVLGIRWAA